jgi:hypothetical protein
MTETLADAETWNSGPRAQFSNFYDEHLEASIACLFFSVQ